MTDGNTVAILCEEKEEEKSLSDITDSGAFVSVLAGIPVHSNQSIMEEIQCTTEAKLIKSDEGQNGGHSIIKRALRSRNDLLIMFLVLAQTIQSSWASALTNVMVQSELSDGQFSRWISLDNLKFKETSLTPEAG